MTTIYMKSADGQTVGAFQIKPRGNAARAMAALEREGYTEISESEFRTMKKEILRRMVEPEQPQPSNAA